MTITIETGITIGTGIAIGQIPVVGGSGITHTVTAVGNAQVSTAQAKFGSGSYTSNSTAGFLRVTPTTDFAWGTGDFTLEFWYRPTSFTQASTLLGFRPAAEGPYPTIFINTNTSVGYFTNSTTRITTAANVIIQDQWNSIAAVRFAGNTRLYINGVQSGTTFADSTNYLAGNCIIGANDFTQNGQFPARGNMDEIRLSNVARYTSNYTPATAPFTTDANTRLLLHCDGVNGSTVFPDSSNSI